MNSPLKPRRSDSCSSDSSSSSSSSSSASSSSSYCASAASSASSTHLPLDDERARTNDKVDETGEEPNVVTETLTTAEIQDGEKIQIGSIDAEKSPETVVGVSTARSKIVVSNESSDTSIEPKSCGVLNESVGEKDSNDIMVREMKADCSLRPTMMTETAGCQRRYVGSGKKLSTMLIKSEIEQVAKFEDEDDDGEDEDDDGEDENENEDDDDGGDDEDGKKVNDDVESVGEESNAGEGKEEETVAIEEEDNEAASDEGNAMPEAMEAEVSASKKKRKEKKRKQEKRKKGKTAKVESDNNEETDGSVAMKKKLKKRKMSQKTEVARSEKKAKAETAENTCEDESGKKKRKRNVSDPIMIPDKELDDWAADLLRRFTSKQNFEESVVAALNAANCHGVRRNAMLFALRGDVFDEDGQVRKAEPDHRITLDDPVLLGLLEMPGDSREERFRRTIVTLSRGRFRHQYETFSIEPKYASSTAQAKRRKKRTVVMHRDVFCDFAQYYSAIVRMSYRLVLQMRALFDVTF